MKTRQNTIGKSYFSTINSIISVLKNMHLNNRRIKSIFVFLSCLQIICLTPESLYAQSHSKSVGSFIFDNNAFTYEFVKENNTSFSLSIQSLTAKKISKSNTSEISKTGKSSKDSSIIPNKEKPDTGKSSKDSSTISNQRKSDSTESSTNKRLFAAMEITEFTKVFCSLMDSNYHIKTDTILKNKASEVFYSILTKLDFLEDEPITAYLVLRKDNVVSVLKTNSSKWYDGRLTEPLMDSYVKEVTVETDAGAIKNISLKLVESQKKTTSRSFLEFKNLNPISISNGMDPHRFAEYNLYCFNCGGIKDLTRYIRLSDLLILDIILDNDKEDYSPAKNLVSLSPSSPIVELKKEKRSQILEVSTFTDFVGLDSKQPNGLIQIEAKRKIYLNTKYKPSSSHFKENDGVSAKYDLGDYNWTELAKRDNLDSKNEKDSEKRYFLIYPKKSSSNLEQVIKKIENTTMTLTELKSEIARQSGTKKDSIIIDSLTIRDKNVKPNYRVWFNNLEFNLLLSKLDDNNRQIVLTDNELDNFQVSPLKLHQHQLISLGLNLNTLKKVYPDLKMSWNVMDIGLHWSQSKVIPNQNATNLTVSPLNTAVFTFCSSLDFKPENRWSASINLAYMKQRLFHEDFSLANKGGLYRFGFDGALKTNNTSKIFFRFRWLYDADYAKYNYTQTQLGYSMNLFGNL